MKKNQDPRLALLAALSAACLAALLAAFLSQRADLARVRKAYGELRERGAGLQENPAPAPAQAPGTAAAAAPAPSPAARPPAAERNRLSMAGAETASVPGGLAATMRFAPGGTGPLGLVALAVRLPRDSRARILGLAPVGPAVYGDFSKEVSEDGRFAFFQGTLGDEKDVRLALTVSGPTAATVTGSCGIKPFALSVRAPGKAGGK